MRISLLTAVQLPTLWRRIDVSGNRRRHPADTESEKDQQDELRALAAPDRQYEYENNHPGDGEACAVDPIVSEAKHLLFLSKDTIDNFSSVGTLMGKSRIPAFSVPFSDWGAALSFLGEALPCSFLHDLSLRISLCVISIIAYRNNINKD